MKENSFNNEENNVGLSDKSLKKQVEIHVSFFSTCLVFTKSSRHPPATLVGCNLPN